MSGSSSVTAWIAELKTGDQEAAQKLWERYFRRVVGLARTKLRKSRCRAAGEEDAAQSAFASFFRGAAEGRFPQLRDRNNLWPLLVIITAHKAADLVQRECAKKRGGGKVRGESALLEGSNSNGSNGGIHQLIGREPNPAFAAELAEEYERLLAKLGEPSLQRIAVLKLEGYSDSEVAAKLGCGLRTVERKMERIRGLWQKEVIDDPIRPAG